MAEVSYKKRTLIDSREIPNPYLAFPYNDVALEVENQVLYVTRCVLSEASPVFKKMFESGFRETYMNVIKLRGKKVEDVTLFLKCIYPFIAQPVTPDTVLRILPLAHEYLAKNLLSQCENVILKHCAENIKIVKEGGTQTINLGIVLSYLAACEKFSLQGSLLGTAAELASLTEFSTLKNHEGFKCLSEATKWLIATKRIEEFEQVYRRTDRSNNQGYVNQLYGNQYAANDVRSYNFLFNLQN